MSGILLIFGIFTGLYLFMLKGRQGHPGLSVFRKYLYAHRGLHGNSVPENSLEAFRRAFEHGYGAETDLHLMKDGNICILHDGNFLRMTGREGIPEEMTAAELKNYFLSDTDQTVPTLQQVLSLCNGRVPLILELKTRNGNGEKLAETACQILESYQGPYALQSFDPRCVRWLKKNRPELLRGQLSENFMKAQNPAVPGILRLLASWQLETFLTQPDYIAQKFCDRKTLSNFLIRRLWRIQGIAWTIRSQEELDQALKEGWIPIFEGFIPSGHS